MAILQKKTLKGLSRIREMFFLLNHTILGHGLCLLDAGSPSSRLKLTIFSSVPGVLQVCGENLNTFMLTTYYTALHLAKQAYFTSLFSTLANNPKMPFDTFYSLFRPKVQTSVWKICGHLFQP